MSDLVQYTVRDRVAVIAINNPPVNALSSDVWDALIAATKRAEADTDARAMVIIGAGATFPAGADIGMFKTIKTREQALARSVRMHAILRTIEDTTLPIVAAIHGTALGGGLELAMTCHYRVAAASAKVGQPEIHLGLIPGASGTQRLPRLAGPVRALEMCLDGKPVSAPDAKAAGIIDQIVNGDLLAAAIQAANRLADINQRRVTRQIQLDDQAIAAGLDACKRARERLVATIPAQPAVIAAIEACLTLPFDQGSVREGELFAECLASTESRALRHLFFAEREAAKVPGLSKATAAEIRRAAVVGAGTMGGGIAMAYANAGIPVLLKEIDEAALDRGLAIIRRNYESTVAKGRLTQEALEQRMSLITPVTTFDRFTDVDIVVEAVFEDLDVKVRTFEELGRVTRPDCVLASNTSTLDIDALAQASARPDKVIGHHFFSPANVMRLLEIVRGRDTSLDTIATSTALGKRLGKVPVVVGNCFGFVANRMLGYYLREATLLLEEGASVAQIDRALVAFGMPVGPFGMEDIAGIDIGARIRKHLRANGRRWADGPESVLPDRLFEMGRYGQKTGAGWYRYEAGNRTPIPDPEIDRLAAEAAAGRGVTRRTITDQEIIDRCMTALANEGARVLEEGYALRPGDIDVIYCYGFGFPRHRGGPMFYADTIGLPTLVQRIHEYAARFGDHWRPAALLERMAAEGRRLYHES